MSSRIMSSEVQRRISGLGSVMKLGEGGGREGDRRWVNNVPRRAEMLDAELEMRHQLGDLVEVFVDLKAGEMRAGVHMKLQAYTYSYMGVI